MPRWRILSHRHLILIDPDMDGVYMARHAWRIPRSTDPYAAPIFQETVSKGTIGQITFAHGFNAVRDCFTPTEELSKAIRAFYDLPHAKPHYNQIDYVHVLLGMHDQRLMLEYPERCSGKVGVVRKFIRALSEALPPDVVVIWSSFLDLISKPATRQHYEDIVSHVRDMFPRVHIRNYAHDNFRVSHRVQWSISYRCRVAGRILAAINHEVHPLELLHLHGPFDAEPVPTFEVDDAGRLLTAHHPGSNLPKVPFAATVPPTYVNPWHRSSPMYETPRMIANGNACTRPTPVEGDEAPLDLTVRNNPPPPPPAEEEPIEEAPVEAEPAGEIQYPPRVAIPPVVLLSPAPLESIESPVLQDLAPLFPMESADSYPSQWDPENWSFS